MNNWKHISEYEKFPQDATYAHCDTRDFHMVVNIEQPSEMEAFNKCFRTKAHMENYMVRGDEILGLLATIEAASTPKHMIDGIDVPRGGWRYLSYKNAPGKFYKDWLKYIRFMRVDDNAYLVYTTRGGERIPLKRDVLIETDYIDLENLHWMENSIIGIYDTSRTNI